jgi:aminoglycoside phosphotransferase family enzyme/predicted kinase
VNAFRVEELLTGAAYPHAAAHLRLHQTHISWIVLTGPYAYKIKKPVHFPFLDASTLERRRRLCEEELRLNLRFAPDLYVDVVPIVRHDGGLVVGGAGEPIEFAVRMHEFDPSQELAALLDERAVTSGDIRSIAGQVAGAHLQADVAPADGPFGTFEKVRAPMLDNFALLRSLLQDPEELRQLGRLSSWCADSLARLEPAIRGRLRDGMVRECHGDLHARNIVRWRQRWLPFDCLEFDPDLRWIDVIGDVAFLYMDLVSRQRADLASEFLNRYLEETGDYAGLRLLPLYAAYFALVRAKVDALDAANATAAQLETLKARLAQRLAAAMRFMEKRPPALVLMHGVSGSGKSWLSERLVPEIRAVRIRSDLERKRLSGAGDYAAAAVDRTYQRLAECAECALDGGCNVIIDATFLERAHRDLFRALARRRHCGFLIVSCSTDTVTLGARIDRRADGGGDPSEATRAVLDHQLRSQQPLAADEMPEVVTVDTSRLVSADAAIAALRARLTALGCLPT